DIKIKDSEIVVLKSKLEKIINEKDALETKIKKFENASQSLNKLIGSQVTDNSKKGLGYVSYNDVPPPHTRRFSPPRINLSHTGLPEFAESSVQSYRVKPIEVVTQKSSVKISTLVKENNGTPLIEDCELDEEDLVDSPSEKERKIVEPGVDKGHSQKKIEDQGYFNSGCSQHMTGNISYLTNFKEFDEGYVAFSGGAKGGKITSKRTIRTAKLDFKDVYFFKEL
nr:ribonuclease H-like domain-containing protein [Tanacetum cinerariifolium]